MSEVAGAAGADGAAAATSIPPLPGVPVASTTGGGNTTSAFVTPTKSASTFKSASGATPHSEAGDASEPGTVTSTAMPHNCSGSFDAASFASLTDAGQESISALEHCVADIIRSNSAGTGAGGSSAGVSDAGIKSVVAGTSGSTSPGGAMMATSMSGRAASRTRSTTSTTNGHASSTTSVGGGDQQPAGGGPGQNGGMFHLELEPPGSPVPLALAAGPPPHTPPPAPPLDPASRFALRGSAAGGAGAGGGAAGAVTASGTSSSGELSAAYHQHHLHHPPQLQSQVGWGDLESEQPATLLSQPWSNNTLGDHHGAASTSQHGGVVTNYQYGGGAGGTTSRPADGGMTSPSGGAVRRYAPRDHVGGHLYEGNTSTPALASTSSYGGPGAGGVSSQQHQLRAGSPSYLNHSYPISRGNSKGAGGAAGQQHQQLSSSAGVDYQQFGHQQRTTSKQGKGGGVSRFPANAAGTGTSVGGGRGGAAASTDVAPYNVVAASSSQSSTMPPGSVSKPADSNKNSTMATATGGVLVEALMQSVQEPARVKEVYKESLSRLLDRFFEEAGRLREDVVSTGGMMVNPSSMLGRSLPLSHSFGGRGTIERADTARRDVSSNRGGDFYHSTSRSGSKNEQGLHHVVGGGASSDYYDSPQSSSETNRLITDGGGNRVDWRADNSFRGGVGAGGTGGATRPLPSRSAPAAGPPPGLDGSSGDDNKSPGITSAPPPGLDGRGGATLLAVNRAATANAEDLMGGVGGTTAGLERPHSYAAAAAFMPPSSQTASKLTSSSPPGQTRDRLFGMEGKDPSSASNSASETEQTGSGAHCKGITHIRATSAAPPLNPTMSSTSSIGLSAASSATTPAGAAMAKPSGARLHRDIPRQMDLEREFGQDKNKGPVTTAMIRHIPNDEACLSGYARKEGAMPMRRVIPQGDGLGWCFRRRAWILALDKFSAVRIILTRYDYSVEQFRQELDELGFEKCYDFLNLPVDRLSGLSVGYCFVNFLDESHFHRCFRVFENYQFKLYRESSWKRAQVSVAHIQGLEKNVTFSAKNVAAWRHNTGSRPLVFYKNGSGQLEQMQSTTNGGSRSGGK